MENIIKKAIEGEYYGERADMPIKYEFDNSFSLRLHGADYVDEKEMVCDPLFWQALGKACGWTSDGKFSRFSDNMTFGEFEKRHWKTHALRFHEINLTEGWDKAVNYLTEQLEK